MSDMRAIVMTRVGDASVLESARVPRPTRVGAELLVRVVAAGVNPIDVKTRSGRGAFPGLAQLPAVLGYDFSGVVEESPYQSHPLTPGTEVYGMLPFPRVSGSYAEFVSVNELHVIRAPRSLDLVSAAAVPLAALTAWGLVVDQARAHEGQRILIHAGAGGVGHFAVQFAHYFGAHVITTTSSGNAEAVRAWGAAEVIDYPSVAFDEVLAEHPVDVVIDLVGNDAAATGPRSLAVLRPGGLLLNAPSGSWDSLDEDARAAGVRATRFQVSPSGATLAIVSRLLDSGDVRVHVDRTFALEAAADAHRAIESGHTRGKIVLDVAGSS